MTACSAGRRTTELGGFCPLFAVYSPTKISMDVWPSGSFARLHAVRHFRFNAFGVPRVLQVVMVLPRLVYSSDASQTPLAERTEDELMLLAQAGSRPAFATLVARHAERVVNLCARFVNDTPAGQELAQDTWVAVWQAREKFRQGSAFMPWLITVARNLCRNHLRHRQTRERHARSSPMLEASPSAEQIERLLLEEHQRRVQRALAALPEAMREALLLRYAEDLRYDEMAQVVGTGESTLRSRVHHGLKILKDKLEQDR